MKYRNILTLFISLSLSISCNKDVHTDSHSKIATGNSQQLEIENNYGNLEIYELDFVNIFYDRSLNQNKVNRVIDSISITHDNLFSNISNTCKDLDLDILIVDPQNSDNIDLNQIFGSEFKLQGLNGYYFLQDNSLKAKIFLNSNLGIPLLARTTIHEYYHHFQISTCATHHNPEIMANNFSTQVCRDTRLCENY
jgi:hypothetical protein